MSKESKNQPKSSFSITKILAPIDGSENAKRALEAAIRLAKDYNALLVILTVIPMPTYLVETPTPGPSIEYYYDYARKDAKRLSDDALALAQKAGVKVRSEVIEAATSVAGTIISNAVGEKADLIVMGTRGLGGFKKLLLGSVSNGVVTHSHCNVLIVR